MDPRVFELEQAIASAMGWDRAPLRRQLRAWLKRSRGKQVDPAQFDRLQQAIAKSQSLRRDREFARPRIPFPSDLPVTNRREEIADAIFENQVVIVCGETGSGKSTQLPKICLDLGRGIDAMIGHTQPRRIAARSIAQRISEELDRPLGTAVGYKVRFQESVGPQTYIKLMTDGLLLAETQHDRFLERYDTLIIDEAHERSLNIDFLLGFLRNLLPQRPDLKLIITSATIEAERFSRFFRHRDRAAPIIEVSGRMFPVELRYRPSGEPQSELDADWPKRIVETLAEFHEQPFGDVLVFLPTEYLILETAKLLRGTTFPGDPEPAEVVPLYARLSAKEQQRVFEPHERRRIVLATNVAESSLTVPGIRYVIDTGIARVSRYSSRSRMQRLPIERISQASADQRAGRSGRVAPGVAVRLYSQDDYATRDRYATPEICRTNLASVILQTKALQLGPIEHFPFLDPPRSDLIRDGYDTLYEIGALDDLHEITPLGRQIAKLPVDPRVARMIVASMHERCVEEILIIASALEVQDPRERPTDRQEAADEAHAQFHDPHSDFLSYLKLWRHYQALRESSGQRQLRRKCQESFLSYQRLREWTDIHRQLSELVREQLLPRSTPKTAQTKPHPEDTLGGVDRFEASRSDSVRSDHEAARYAAIHRSILSGLLSGIACRTDEFEYSGANGNRLFLWPGSGTFLTRPKWILAAELVETSRRYARTVARIEPGWIEPLARHLIERNYRDAFWSQPDGSAMLLERVTLFGLPIVKRRRVRCGPIDPRTAQELLIREGLVDGQINLRAPFLRNNQQLLEDLARNSAKLRHRDSAVSRLACADFYLSRLPPQVVDARSLNHWRMAAERDNPRLLMMRVGDLIDSRVVPPTPDLALFPDTLSLDAIELPLEYRFEPGSEDDGVTIVIPLSALNRIPQEPLDWLVPGMLAEKIEALLRGLTKSQRRELPPAPDAAKEITLRLSFRSGPFLPALAREASRLAGGTISPREFDEQRIPHHLRMKIRIVDDHSRTLARGENIDELRRQLGVATEIQHEIIEPGWQREGLEAWEFAELPRMLEIRRGGIRLPAYPALLDHGSSVSLTLLDDKLLADHLHRAGLRRLLVLRDGTGLHALIEWLPHWLHWTRQLAALGDAEHVRGQLVERLVDQAYLDNLPLPTTRDEFERCVTNGREASESVIHEIAQVLTPAMRNYGAVCDALHRCDVPTWRYAVDDICGQLDHLIFDGFLIDVPWRWWQHYPRYLRAIGLRLERLRDGSVDRDRRNTNWLRPLWQQFETMTAQHQQLGIVDPELENYRWMLEEYRVSLFAQTLGTAITISPQRLEAQWERVRK